MKRYTISLSLIAAGLIFLAGMWWQEARHIRACETAGGLKDTSNRLICMMPQEAHIDAQVEQEPLAQDPDTAQIVNDSPQGKTKTVRGQIVSSYDDRAFDGHAGVVLQVGGGQIKVATIPSGFGGVLPVGEVDVPDVGEDVEVYGHYYLGPSFPDASDSMDVFGEEFYLKKI